MTCPNGIKKTTLVSFPRSGHHLLVRGLTEAAGHRLVYSELYKCKHNMTNCDYVNLQKSHDLELTDPINPDMNYIVLIRGFEMAIESWFNVNESEDFEQFRQSKLDYYDQFMEKWLTNEVPNRLIITYADLIDNKKKTIMKASDHMGFDPDLDKVVMWEWRERVRYNEKRVELIG